LAFLFVEPLDQNNFILMSNMHPIIAFRAKVHKNGQSGKSKTKKLRAGDAEILALDLIGLGYSTPFSA
jgi:hypothetical protein